MEFAELKRNANTKILKKTNGFNVLMNLPADS